MKRYVMIGIGGFSGAISRYLLRNLIIIKSMGDFPLNTLVVNISGSLVLAFILTLAIEGYTADEDIKLGITTGFCGAFTTFSTLSKELVFLLEGHQYFLAAGYTFASCILGLLCICLGTLLAKSFYGELE